MKEYKYREVAPKPKIGRKGVTKKATKPVSINEQWQETARGRLVYKANLAKENAKDEYVRVKLTSAPSFQKLLAAAVRFQVSLQGKAAKQHTTEQYEQQPWGLLTAHAGVMNVKSARAKTLAALTDTVYAETGLPRKSRGKFRGEDSLDWDAVQPTSEPVVPEGGGSGCRESLPLSRSVKR